MEEGNHIPYFQGYIDHSFRPDNPITRAEAVAVFFRLLINSDKNLTVPQQFGDVPGGLWCTQYINYLAHIGIITGIQAGSVYYKSRVCNHRFEIP